MRERVNRMKKLLFALLMLVCIFALTACTNETTLNSTTGEEQVKNQSEILDSISDAIKDAFD